MIRINNLGLFRKLAINSIVPRVSAYVPCYNNENTILTAVESIRKQTIAVEEIYVIDDGSTDDSVQICEAAGIRVIKMGHNQGRGFVRKTAINNSKHDILFFLDATNTVESTFLESGLKWIEHNEFSAVYGKISCAKLNTSTNRWKDIYLFKSREEPLVSEIKHTGNSMLNCGACVLKKKDILKVGNFNSLMRHGEDNELGKRLNAAGFKTIGDYQMKIFCMRNDNLISLLNRYSRWYSSNENITLISYLKQVILFIKYAIYCDMKEGDYRRAFISLVCPHYHFLKNNFFE